MLETIHPTEVYHVPKARNLQVIGCGGTHNLKQTTLSPLLHKHPLLNEKRYTTAKYHK
jgi:hypothetical protein